MVIRDLEGQVNLAVNEVKSRYTKGMTFNMYDLLATKSCEGANNFSSYKIRLEVKLISTRTTSRHSIRNGITTFIKL